MMRGTMRNEQTVYNPPQHPIAIRIYIGRDVKHDYNEKIH